MKNNHLQRPAGFTLIELIVSVALMSVILTSGYLCLRAGLASRDLIQTRADAIQNARVALALISADLRAATPLSEENEFLGMNRTVDGMEADNLDFATHNYRPRRLREGDFCEISYFLNKNPQTGEFGLWRRRDPTPDSKPLAGGEREEIATGIRGLRFEFYDGFDWYDDWGDPDGRYKNQDSWLVPWSASGMPEAVRITLLVAPGPPKRPPSTQPPTEPGFDAASAQAEEPPLVFETTVRLNLAGISSSGASSSGTSAAENSSADPDSSNQRAP